MTFSSLRSLRATSIIHRDRGLTLIFGSGGQVSLIGFDGGPASQTTYVSAVSITGVLTPGTGSLPSQSIHVSRIPNLEATSASFTGSSSSTSTPTSTPSASSNSSSLASSSYDPSSSATETDTNLPSIPTVNYPTPSPTPASNPKDHGVGAPFYLAIVLASISFIGCIAAFIAWWIRSRSRRRDLEFDDPWIHHDTSSDAGSHNAHTPEEGNQPRAETQTRPYYLPASIVRRSSSNLLAVPHTIQAMEDGTLQNGTSRVVEGYSSLSRANGPRSQNIPSSQMVNPYARPGAERIQTGLSVQESTRTLGKLRVANRVPGDVTSGDEGGIHPPRLRNNAVGLSSVPNADGFGTTPVGENVMHNMYSERNDRVVEEVDGPLEPPGPATLPWGRRVDTVAALRRTRRQTPGPNALKNSSYGEHVYPTVDGGQSGVSWSTPAAPRREGNEVVHANPQPDSLRWTNTLKSSFWQAVDAVTGSRPSDLELRAPNAGNGSGFTPAPQRVASRRSPASPVRPTTNPILPDPLTARSQDKGVKYDLTFPDKALATQDLHQILPRAIFDTPPTKRNESQGAQISAAPLEVASSPPPRVSRLNRNLSGGTRGRHPDSLRTDTSSVYSTESAAARANLRKYGYGDPIPSSWSALGAIRESQLNLNHTFLPLPGPVTSSPRPLSVTPSQLTLESGFLSSSASVRTDIRTPMHSQSDLVGSGRTSRSGKHANAASSTYSMSRNSTIQSGMIGGETVPLHPSSTTSSMLSRKKGVTTRRKRPRPPPRTPSSASSVQSLESGLSIREVAVRRALLERRKKVKAAESLKGREDSVARGSFLL